MRAATRVIEEYGITDPDLIIAGLLHDSVEDQAGLLAQKQQTQGGEVSGDTRRDALSYLKAIYGSRVAHIVAALSNPELPKDTAQAEKNRHYKEHVAHAIQEEDVLYIKLADFSDNGFNLASVLDTPRRLKLGDKYEPVLDVFFSG
ncbi:MAG: hypothetical protein AAB400_03955 [Patescibacteria group bacterium]